MSDKYLSEYQPTWKRITNDDYPPAGVKLLLRTQYGTAIVGQYYPAGEFTHWCGLPKLDEIEKEWLKQDQNLSERRLAVGR